MNANDKQYKALTLRLGFALLLMFVLLQGLMTVLGFGHHRDLGEKVLLNDHKRSLRHQKDGKGQRAQT